MAVITTRSYPGGDEKVTTGDLDGLSDLVAGGASEVLWVDLDDPAKHDLVHLAAELGLHHLAVEDALGAHQRDKYVHFEGHVFLVAHDVRLDVDAAELRPVELDVFIGDRWMVTVHRGAGDLIGRVVARWDKARRSAGCHIGVAVYCLLDVIVDGYFDTIDRFEAYYDEAADQIFGEQPIEPHAHRHWFEMRRSLNRFDRIVRPLTEAMTMVVDQDLERFGRASAPYLRDAEGDLARASAEVDSLRELVDHLVDANLVLRDYRQNQVMKKVTSWAAIIAVPTLVTGFYGMNVPFPGEGETWGVVTSSAIAVGCSGALYLLFRRRSWL
jgi:magnesium transporter